MNNFYDFIGDKYLSEIKLIDGENYRINLLKDINKTSTNIKIRAVKAAFEKAVKWEMILQNPFKSIKQLKIQESNIPKYLTKEEVKMLLEDINNKDFNNLVRFYLYTGCRRNEALRLKWGDVDLKRKRIIFRVTKGSKSRTVPINQNLLAMLKRKSRENKEDLLFNYRPDYVTHKLKKHLRKIGVNSRISVHSLRHTFASHLVMSGIDLYTVQKLLGHSDISVTSIYSHLAPDYLSKSVENLFFD